ncbi:hypothetical protein KM043_009228 [Ampulex compressa]|nr:hypothetical protein KM043_009228 [Ampulex compressa]
MKRPRDRKGPDRRITRQSGGGRGAYGGSVLSRREGRSSADTWEESSRRSRTSRRPVVRGETKSDPSTTDFCEDVPMLGVRKRGKCFKVEYSKTGEKRSGGACAAFDSSEQSERRCPDASSMTMSLGATGRPRSAKFGSHRLSSALVKGTRGSVCGSYVFVNV